MDRSLFTRLGPVLLLALAALSSGGCARRQKGPDIVWPFPPEVARVRYVQKLQTEEDLNPSFLRRLVRAVIPHSTALVTSPTGIALSSDEQRLLVACGSAGRVVVFDLERRAADLHPFHGRDVPASAAGVAVDEADNLYVSDRTSNNVYVFDKEGTFLRKFGKDRLITPTSLALDRRRQVLYVISGGSGLKNPHTIEVYTARGEHLRTLGGERGEQHGQFNFPQHLTVAPNGDLWVSDMLNFRVQIFDPEGSFRATFGQGGTGSVGAFDKIKGIAFDTFENIYVVDAQQGVHVFNRDYHPLMLFGNQPISNVPGGIVIDSKNRIYVTDFGTNRVHVFQLINTKAEDSFASTPAPAAPDAKSETSPIQAPSPAAAEPAPAQPSPAP